MIPYPVECDECGGTAAVLDAEAIQMDQDVTCPECGTRYIVNCDDSGREPCDVWLSRVDDRKAGTE